jgi:GTPase SAR1 family protein
MAVRTNIYKEVIKKGKKSWNRTKIMLMGEGRAGKTCLGRALLGKPFENTSSTEALDTLAVGINCGAFTDNGKNWEERPQSSCVLEEAIGAMARDTPISPPPRGIPTGLSRFLFGSRPLRRPDTTQLSVADGISVDTRHIYTLVSLQKYQCTLQTRTNLTLRVASQTYCPSTAPEERSLFCESSCTILPEPYRDL